MNKPVKIEEYRNGILENVHECLIYAVDGSRNTVMKRGEPSHPIFYRSAMKPIQAIPAFQSNVIEQYGLNSNEAALFMGSHRGEEYHQETLIRLLEKLNVKENDFVCGHAYPLNEAAKHRFIAERKEKRKLFHNCSGKHLGLMAAARAYGYPIDGYEQLGHPIQQHILSILADLSEVAASDIASGKDGCGLPVHAVPLKNMALSYLKFVKPELISDTKTANAVSAVGQVMNKHPEMIAAHRFTCSTLLLDENIIAKGGAQGVYCFALKKERISFAIKVLSGSELVWSLLVAELLKKISYDNKGTIEALYELRPPIIYSDGNDVVGEVVVRI
ncbi:asparaginase [Alteribacter populi]|uniref:asparaginase n=1 Tax=Alteribacter populi TaxID=2011011 RepID=UPI000BBA59B4|nr:asparaginase [Alteribacter populi]